DARSVSASAGGRPGERARLAAALARAADETDRLRARLGVSRAEAHAARVRAGRARLREHRSLRRSGADEGRDRPPGRSRTGVRNTTSCTWRGPLYSAGWCEWVSDATKCRFAVWPIEGCVWCGTKSTP